MTTSLTQRLRRVAAVAALAAIGITGCGATSGSYDAPAVSDQDVAAPGEAATGAPGAGGDSNTGSTGSSSSVSQQALVTTGTATLRAEDPITAAATFTDATVALGGLVAESETSASGDYPTATVTVRIPADKYQELVDRLGEFGEVQEQSSTSTDVGQRLTDLEARMEALQTSIDRLTQLMEGAATTADILEAEAMITERQAELDSLTAQLAYLQNQVSMSTLTVDFAPDAAATSHRVPNAFERGWRSFLDSTDGAIVFLMAVVPWIVILGIPFWLVTAALRRRRPATPAVQPLDYPVPPEGPAAAVASRPVRQPVPDGGTRPASSSSPAPGAAPQGGRKPAPERTPDGGTRPAPSSPEGEQARRGEPSE